MINFKNYVMSNSTKTLSCIQYHIDLISKNNIKKDIKLCNKNYINISIINK